MKLNNMLSMPKEKLDPVFKFDWLPTNLPMLVSGAIVFAMVVVVMQIRQQAQLPETKSLAWYMANPQEALAVNKICFDNPQMKGTENCQNSLHALDVIHRGPNS